MKKTILCGILLGVVACSSTPDTRTSASVNDREEYSAYVEKQLSNFQDNVNDLEGYSKNDLQATLQDARAELRGLNAASESAWRTYKVRLDRNLEVLRNKYNSARAAE